MGLIRTALVVGALSNNTGAGPNYDGRYTPYDRYNRYGRFDRFDRLGYGYIPPRYQQYYQQPPQGPVEYGPPPSQYYRDGPSPPQEYGPGHSNSARQVPLPPQQQQQKQKQPQWDQNYGYNPNYSSEYQSPPPQRQSPYPASGGPNSWPREAPREPSSEGQRADAPPPYFSRDEKK
ncbi:hypothetical protein UA08_08695 [Talaromyces atroroseus]|uniref:Uncharacterized protein n=1 Tax=Talaromyces atroroseus TaxID=1441469 RepID=A0A225AG94_TALAT|nr:hypothetical protein UA08_08695 [Talaromyces atroroseus]OKL56018.1 hypothetical protein UA08_08695 [Talaromyces atroroseus]